MLLKVLMLNQEEYSFDTDQLPPRVKDGTVACSEIELYGQQYKYAVVQPEVFPTHPYFTGMPHGNNLYISMDAFSDPNLCKVSLAREILYHRGIFSGLMSHTQRCMASETEAFELLKDEDLETIKKVLQARFSLFEALLNDLYSVDPESDLRKQIRGTDRWLQMEVDRMQSSGEISPLP